MSSPVERNARNYLEKRLLPIRREIRMLGVYGMGSSYYVEHLGKLEGMIKTTRENLARMELQMELVPDVQD